MYYRIFVVNNLDFEIFYIEEKFNSWLDAKDRVKELQKLYKLPRNLHYRIQGFYI